MPSATARPDGRRPLTNRQLLALANRAERRDEILERAAELFETQGYATTSVGDIADAAHMSKPTLYHYYSSKDEILFDIHDRFTSRLVEEHCAQHERSVEPLDELRALCRSFFRVMHDSRAQVRTFFSFFNELQDAGYRDRILERRSQLSGLVEEVIVRAMDTGELRATSPRLAMLVLTGVFNWAPNWYRPDGSLTADDLGDFVFEIFVNGLRAAKPF